MEQFTAMQKLLATSALIGFTTLPFSAGFAAEPDATKKNVGHVRASAPSKVSSSEPSMMGSTAPTDQAPEKVEVKGARHRQVGGV
ncbi:hypothetical protein DmAi_08390 [Acetobacter persici]|uniref:Serine protease n=1 Tax=Acetobacter persici TaxID=1076596 RepID=A0A6V8I5G6_9PROT|nr:hypothetical protein DmAi_08390 [Acetobacter persici]